MPKQISNDELYQILIAVDSFPKSTSIEEISRKLKQPIPRRTLLRRLILLLRQGAIRTEGYGRGTRYYTLKKTMMEPEPSSRSHYRIAEEPAVYYAIPFSKESEAIQKKLSQPYYLRPRVEFNRDFLDAYQANKTFFLPDQTRKHLQQIGQSPLSTYPAGTFAHKIFDRLLIDLSWNSSRLEGNTYSLLETEHLLQLDEAVEGKDFKDTQMILNHKAAIKFLVDNATSVGFDRQTIFSMHTLLAKNLLNFAACGKLRNIIVGIGNSAYQPLTIPQLIEEYFDQIIHTAASIKDPFEQAFYAMVYLPYLQPFEDVNKRVSRFSANIPLIKKNLCPLSFVDVPTRAYVDGLLGVYEFNQIELLRDVFVWSYERSCRQYSMLPQTLSDPNLFHLKYYKAITIIIKEIVFNKLDKLSAVEKIKQFAAENIPVNDRSKFLEAIETELTSLHEGNIAAHQLLPQDFAQWHENWR